jgi:hypothetical protein
MIQPRILIINADDLGLSPEVDAGILDCVRAGTVTAVSLMVNTPRLPDLAPFVEAGVSICLHWDLVTLPAQCDPRDPEREMRAQLERFRQITGREPAQLNFHKHLHAYEERLLDMALKLARETGTPLRAINPAMRDACRSAGVATTDHFTGSTRPAPYWTLERLREVLATVPAGTTELMCHPGRDVKPIAGLRYLAERDVERATLTSPEAAGLIAGFRLRGFES